MQYWDLYDETKARAALIWLRREEAIGVIKVRAATASWTNGVLTIS